MAGAPVYAAEITNDSRKPSEVNQATHHDEGLMRAEQVTDAVAYQAKGLCGPSAGAAFAG